jgi:hypothetical protein
MQRLPDLGKMRTVVANRTIKTGSYVDFYDGLGNFVMACECRPSYHENWCQILQKGRFLQKHNARNLNRIDNG